MCLSLTAMSSSFRKCLLMNPCLTPVPLRFARPIQCFPVVVVRPVDVGLGARGEGEGQDEQERRE